MYSYASHVQNVLKAFGGKILKVTNGTDPNTKYFRQMVERGAKICTRRNGYHARIKSHSGYRGTTTRGRRCSTTHLFALSILVHSAHALYPSKLLIHSTRTFCAIYIQPMDAGGLHPIGARQSAGLL
jgi:hypothetical protein